MIASMAKNELTRLSAVELARLIRTRKLSPVEVAEAHLAAIGRVNPAVNAFCTVAAEKALVWAREAEAAVKKRARLGALHGVPVAIKDLTPTAGIRTTWGSTLFRDHVPTEDAEVVRRLKAAGAIVIGKTNTPEFGHKGATDNLLFGPTSTPFALGKNAGGSSGGSAAAVADGLAALAQGSDGGGSVRIPASFCGVYGLKASFGRVASVGRPNGFLGHTPYIHAGPLTRTVADGALMLSVMAGPDPRDPLSLPDDGMNYFDAVHRSIKGYRIAYSANFGVFPVDARVTKVVAEAVTAFSLAGAHVDEVNIDLTYTQQELSSLWLRQIGVLYADSVAYFKDRGVDLLGAHRAELTPQFRELLESVHGMSAIDYKMDDIIRTSVFDAVQDVFDHYDILVTPTLAVPPFSNTQDGNTLGPTSINGDAVDPCIGWCLTYPINFTGHPAASIPAGFTDDGLPIGMQIIGRRFADDAVLAASAAFERVRPWGDAYLRL